MSTGTRIPRLGGYPTAHGALTALGILVTTAMVSAVIGPLGVLVALGAGGAQLFIGGTTAFAVGQIILVALYPPHASLGFFVLAEIGLGGVLVGGALRHPESLRVAVATLIAGVALGGGAWLALRSTEAVWAAGGSVVAGTAIVAYGLHRYERVRLGLVETS